MELRRLSQFLNGKNDDEEWLKRSNRSWYRNASETTPNPTPYTTSRPDEDGFVSEISWRLALGTVTLRASDPLKHYFKTCLRTSDGQLFLILSIQIHPRCFFISGNHALEQTDDQAKENDEKDKQRAHLLIGTAETLIFPLLELSFEQFCVDDVVYLVKKDAPQGTPPTPYRIPGYRHI